MSNSVTITVAGNLTDEPELRFAPSGTPVCKFTVAFNSRRLDGDEWKDGEPSFYNCTAFNQLAENIAETLHKGYRVMVVGTWSQRHWVDEKTQEKRSTWQLLVDEVGPSLKFATAAVRKATRSRDGAPPDDTWATASTTRPTDTDWDRARAVSAP